MFIPEVTARKKNIIEGVERFLEEDGLTLSKTKKKKLVDRLFFYFADEKTITASGIHDYLKDHFDWHQPSRDGIDNATDPENSDIAISNILISADKKSRFSTNKKWFIFVFIILAISSYIISFESPTLDTQITVVQAEELKVLVASIIKVENENGNNTSHSAVWNTLKKSNGISKYGYKPSYKEFSVRQYEAAKSYLDNWKKLVQESKNSTDKGKLSKFTASNIIVIDGDTFKVSGVKYRLWGVDAFEIKQQCYNEKYEPYPCGIKAKETLQNIFDNAGNIECIETTKDRYKRSVVKCNIDGVQLGKLLTLSGWVLDYTKYSGEAFKNFENNARKNKTGAWSGCFIAPWDYRHGKNKNKCTSIQPR